MNHDVFVHIILNSENPSDTTSLFITQDGCMSKQWSKTDAFMYTCYCFFTCRGDRG